LQQCGGNAQNAILCGKSLLIQWLVSRNKTCLGGQQVKHLRIVISATARLEIINLETKRNNKEPAKYE